MPAFSANDVPDQSGRTILITGANTGIGYEAALVLAGEGARVLLACRDASRAQAAMARISAIHPQADLGCIPLDLADLASVRGAAKLVQEEARLDVLINNAGVMYTTFSHTRDRFEQQFGINHLGHFALTGLLLVKLAGGEKPRVVTLSSIAHKPGKIDFANLDGRAGYHNRAFYSQSKLANLLFAVELDRRLRAAGSPIASIACHPGVSGTELGRQSLIGNIMMKSANLIFHSPPAAALPTLYAATAPDAKGGDYFGPQGFMEGRGPVGPAKLSEKALDPELARRLWDVSIELTGVDPGLAPERG